MSRNCTYRLILKNNIVDRIWIYLFWKLKQEDEMMRLQYKIKLENGAKVSIMSRNASLDVSRLVYTGVQKIHQLDQF